MQRSTTGLLLGPAAFLVLILIPHPDGLAVEGWRLTAVTVWMAVWWISEAIPIPATALLPIVMFPLLGIMPAGTVTTSYAHHLIFLFIGGFMIAVTMERWELHRRIALHVISRAGTSPARLVLGFMLATALLSMWISNTATAMMMVTIGLALFVIPADWKQRTFLLDWQTAVRIPWDIIILFGGGFALAAGFSETGLTTWLAQQLQVLKGIPVVWVILLTGLLVTFLTEVTSNTATASLLLPVLGALSLAIALPPMMLMVTATLCASFAFMLPVATPPNAIVFGSRCVHIPQMARAGLWLNFMGVLLITAFVYLWTRALPAPAGIFKL